MNREKRDSMQPAEELLSMVSHEIKNPLTSISGFALFAEDAIRKNDQEVALQSLEIVHAEARRILKLAEDLLDESCLRAGRFTIHPQHVDLPALVSGVAERYAQTSRKKIDVCIMSPFPKRISGDPHRLTQVIDNLVSNAVKYCNDDDPIRIAVEVQGEVVRILISNGGMTIPSDKLDSLFEAYSRLPEHSNGNGSHPPKKGTGLGLFIAKQIVELHGGRIIVRSEDGEGTTFTVELPRGDANVADEESN
jgi:signal transduction histidine kinase